MIPHNLPTLGTAEQDAASRVLASGWVAQGREVAAFEDEVCEYTGLESGHAVALSSGTAALFAALWALGAKGKRVAIPVYSCAALRNAVIMAGGMPVAVDVGADSPNIDLDEAFASQADLVIAAHIFGIPGRLPRGSASVPVIEDCAQAFGSRIDGSAAGTQGALGVFSFYATKMLTSGGQGGMLVSRDKALIEAVRDYREFDCRHDRMPRFNLQMTDLQAAVGRAQLRQIDQFLERRKLNRAAYRAAGLPLWPSVLGQGIESCNYRAILRVSDPQRLIAHLEAQGIRAIVPIADWELLEDAERFPRAAALARATVSIPVHPALAHDELVRVVAAAAPPYSSAELEKR
ncbi:MAG: DegT/DnrJ/EryC1/StrS aminotransferase family protein [Gammaproteobacteria bacterium]